MTSCTKSQNVSRCQQGSGTNIIIYNLFELLCITWTDPQKQCILLALWWQMFTDKLNLIDSRKQFTTSCIKALALWLMYCILFAQLYNLLCCTTCYIVQSAILYDLLYCMICYIVWSAILYDPLYCTIRYIVWSAI